jgi:hypothetical protein
LFIKGQEGSYPNVMAATIAELEAQHFTTHQWLII